MLFTYVSTYFFVDLLCMAIGIVIFVHIKNDMGNSKEIATLRAFILMFLLFCLTNSIWIWINNGYLDMSGEFNSIVNLIAICICSFLWFAFVQLKINPKWSSNKVLVGISLVPLVVTILFILTTPITNLVFMYDNGKYVHGSLYVVMVGLAFVYLFIATAQLIKKSTKITSAKVRKEYDNLMRFLFYPLIGGIVDVFIPNLPIMELMMTAGIVTIFTNIQGSRIYTDSLTGVGNRRSAEEFLADQLQYLSEDNALYFFVADVDYLKYINDTYGHFDGNNVLRIISDVLTKTVNDMQSLVSRWGGDEYVIITKEDNIGSPEDFIKLINDNLKERERIYKLPYPLHMSVGYTKVTDKNAKYEDLIASADKMMYDMKESYHDNTTSVDIRGLK